MSGYETRLVDYKCLGITEEEIDALRLYASSRHIDINSLLELDASVISKQQKSGWYIDLSKENIEGTLEVIEKVYSAMYKYSKSASSKFIDRVSRGTSLAEVEKIRSGKSLDRFISTSEDSEVAMTFTEYGNGAIVSIGVGQDVPYICMNDYLDDTQVSEEEVLISPFSKFTKLDEHYSDIDGVKKYSATLQKTEFKSLDLDEREKCLTDFENIDIVKCISEVGALETEIERLSARRKAAVDIEDIKDCTKLIDETQEQYSVKSKEMARARTLIRSLIEDRLRQVELDIDRQIEEETIVKKEEHLQGEITRIGSYKQLLQNQAEELLVAIGEAESRYFGKDEQIESITEIANNQGVVIGDDERYSNEIEDKFARLRENIYRIKQEVDQITTEGIGSIEQFKEQEYDIILEGYSSSLGCLEAVLPDIDSSIIQEKQQLEKAIRQKIKDRVTEKVRSEKMTSLIAEKEQIEAEKVGIFGRLRGKDKLKAERLINVELRISQTQKMQVDIPEDVDSIEEYINMQNEASKTLPIPRRENLGMKKQLEAIRQENTEMLQQLEDGYVPDQTKFELPPKSELSAILTRALENTGALREVKDIEHTLGGI